MTTEEQADALINAARPYVDRREINLRLAEQIDSFMSTNSTYLANNGSAWRLDQLNAAWARLTGNMPDVLPAGQVSPFFYGMKGFANDSTSLDDTIGAAASDQAKRLGSGIANSVNAASGQLVKSPALVAVVVVALVLAAAWAYRSFK